MSSVQVATVRDWRNPVRGSCIQSRTRLARPPLSRRFARGLSYAVDADTAAQFEFYHGDSSPEELMRIAEKDLRVRLANDEPAV